MLRESVEIIRKRMPMLRHCRIAEKGLPQGDWFVFETSPRPSPDIIKEVTSDIKDGIGAFVSNDGFLFHNTECTRNSHTLNDKITHVLERIDNQVFQVAMWEGLEPSLGFQPIPIALNPEISYFIYPDHPHISSSGVGSNCVLPDFLCYTDDPSILGNDPVTRIDNAIRMVCMWLFRHQLWLELRKLGIQMWIGIDVKAEESKQFYYFRDPRGQCRCGLNKPYYQCHLNHDFKNACNEGPMLWFGKIIDFNMFKGNDGNIILDMYNRWWRHNRWHYQYWAFGRLREALIKC